MTTELNLDELTAVRLFVLQRAIGALIVTHPAPAEFARAFAAGTAMQQVDQLSLPGARPAVYRESSAFARELIELANDEALRRQSRTPPSD